MIKLRTLLSEIAIITNDELKSIWDKHGENLPSIFTHTIYQLPNTDELREFEKYPNLTANDIIQGFGYTMVGRGIISFKSSNLMKDGLRMLSEMYPDNKIYKQAYESLKICPKCGNDINFLRLPESGMGYVKCPKCNTAVIQSN
jgi:hypothetical protein